MARSERGELAEWQLKGFAGIPERKVAEDKGLVMYRCWGGGSKEYPDWRKDGYFSPEKPSCVTDAELRFNIVDYGNMAYFLTTFKLTSKFLYYIGPVLHGDRVLHGHRDVFIPASQIMVPHPVTVKIEFISRETLKQDRNVVRNYTSLLS